MSAGIRTEDVEDSRAAACWSRRSPRLETATTTPDVATRTNANAARSRLLGCKARVVNRSPHENMFDVCDLLTAGPTAVRPLRLFVSPDLSLDKGKLPDELVRSMEAWSGCVSGAPEKDEYERLLREAGFEDVSVEVTHTYEEEFAEASGCCSGSGCGDTATTAATTASAEVPLASAFIRGRKPAGRAS